MPPARLGAFETGYAEKIAPILQRHGLVASKRGAGGRRDTVFIYQGPKMAAVVKEQYKLHIPGYGENFIVADFYDLFRDPGESKPVSTPVGAWAAASFIDIIKRHQMMKKRFPDTPPATGRPYSGIENLRPESKALVDAWMAWQKKLSGK